MRTIWARQRLTAILTAVCLLLGSTQSMAGPDRSQTELHLQYGALRNPEFAGGGNLNTFTSTLHHASTWGATDIFFFIDHRIIEGGNKDVYGEVYTDFSLGKLSGTKMAFGPLKDIGLRLGINFSADTKVRRYLPGLSLSWDVPGFQYVNTDITAFIDDSRGLDAGGAPKQSDTWSFDVSWSRPFKLGGSRFLFFGHTEYVGSRTDELDNSQSWWVLAQPQLRFDLGHALNKQADKLFVGVEWQVWINKQGEDGTDENAVQALIAWRF